MTKGWLKGVTMEDRYTVISEAGIVIRRPMTAVDAADEILMHDGHS